MLFRILYGWSRGQEIRLLGENQSPIILFGGSGRDDYFKLSKLIVDGACTFFICVSLSYSLMQLLFVYFRTLNYICVAS